MQPQNNNNATTGTTTDNNSIDNENTDFLPLRLQRLYASTDRLQQNLQATFRQALQQQSKAEDLIRQSYLSAKWPIEAVAARRGLRLTTTTTTTTATNIAGDEEKDETQTAPPSLDEELRRIRVDRIERLPSPYLWQLLEDMEGRIARLHEDERHYPLMLQLLLPAQQQSSPPTSNTIQTIFFVATAVQTQQQALWTAVQQAAARSARVDQVRRQYDNYSRRTRTRHHYPYSNGNVLEAARRQEREHQQRIEDQIRGMYVQVAGTTTTTNTTGNTTTTTTLGTAGATTTTKPRVFSFSSSTFGAPTLAAPAAFGTAVFLARHRPLVRRQRLVLRQHRQRLVQRRPLARRRPLVVLCP